VKIEIPKVVRSFRLADHAPEYGDRLVHVWVNPSRAMLREWAGLSDELTEDNAEKALERVYAWWSEIWSVGPETWSPEDVMALAEVCAENDPALWAFMQKRSWELIAEYRGLARKN
jgi:hypothetical protein